MKLPRDIITRTREIITADGGLRCDCGNSVNHDPLCSLAQHNAATARAWQELRPEGDEE